jgi:hypothetical protein
MDEYGAAELFVEWLEHRSISAARGDTEDTLEVDPGGKFWLGRLASEREVANSRLGDRAERLDPCAIGVRIRPAAAGPWTFEIEASARAWVRKDKVAWRKTEGIRHSEAVTVPLETGTYKFAQVSFERQLQERVGVFGLSAEIRVDVEMSIDGKAELVILLVNTSPEEHSELKDTHLYECELRVSGVATAPFVLEALPDSFRYDRNVPAYGINCGVRPDGHSGFVTVDVISVARSRPRFWTVSGEPPNLRFAYLAKDPLGPAEELLRALVEWGRQSWSTEVLAGRANQEHWSSAMQAEAGRAASDFDEECGRIRRGVDLLRDDVAVRRAFQAMNEGMQGVARGKYDAWRPFQYGFLLANLADIVDRTAERGVVDIVWFATGGGKTETYLGLLMTAVLYDRVNGKVAGTTAWSRFPLRMLSLQQTQRFANAVAAMEIVRRKLKLPGDPISLGFLVGQSATPNSIDPEPKSSDQWDPDDPEMPGRLRVLQECPFCRSSSIEMSFNRLLWRVEHLCADNACPSEGQPLPIFVVDDEIYRFLPSLIVGTLDKAASLSMRAAMRGLVGAPLGLCPRSGHGYTYARRSKQPNGCLVPGCTAEPGALPQDAKKYGPAFRLQDELHLLRDSLGAVDAHYEALLDGLQTELCGHAPKILASSATLEGFRKQSDVLYRRPARVFPQPPPSAEAGFWTGDGGRQMRRFVAVAPRGVTIEYAVDRLLTELQVGVRELLSSPNRICREAGIDPVFAPFLVSVYGTNVIYGNTLRDLDAVMRSAETQIQVTGPVNTASLTGRTPFDDVRDVLRRLENPEGPFENRIHVVAASAMMSHGVDIDRLNVMVMLGLPLGAAEFIQTTARIGRRWPGIVFVIHKIGRERDAAVYRSFEQFVKQGDRFVEAIPITRRSRRVLDKTIAGLELARILMIHEPKASSALSTIARIRDYARQGGLNIDGEIAAIVRYLQITSPLDESLRSDLTRWFERFGRNIADPPTDGRFVSDLSPTGPPMRSLRDVEEQVPVIGTLVK